MIRPTEEEDLRDMLSLAAGFFKRSEVACIQELLENYLYKPEQKDYVFLSYVDHDRLVGFICYGPTPLTETTFSLYWICVSRDHSVHGAGSALLADVEARIARGGGRLFLVETSSRPEYAPARRFYSRHGFAQLAIIPDFYGARDDLMVYGKRRVGSKSGAARACSLADPSNSPSQHVVPNPQRRVEQEKGQGNA